MVLWSNASCIRSGGRGFKFPARINLLSSRDFIYSLAFDEKKREEEEESCRRGLSSREDAEMIGIRQRNLRGNGRAEEEAQLEVYLH